MTGKYAVTRLSAQQLTSNDTKYSLKVDGRVLAQHLDNFGGGQILDLIQAGTASEGPIVCEQEVEFFIQTRTKGNNVRVWITYLELE